MDVIHGEEAFCIGGLRSIQLLLILNLTVYTVLWGFRVKSDIFTLPELASHQEVTTIFRNVWVLSEV